MQSPSGNEDEEEKYLHKKVKAWNQKSYNSALRRHDVTKAVNVTIVRTIRYVLVATAMDFEQCDTNEDTTESRITQDGYNTNGQ